MLAKLSSDPATETTLAAILAQLDAPTSTLATETTLEQVDSDINALGLLLTDIMNKLVITSVSKNTTSCAYIAGNSAGSLASSMQSFLIATPLNIINISTGTDIDITGATVNWWAIITFN